MMSGVYYVKVPDDAGDIIIPDPRGGAFQPPFEGSISIKPQEGELLIFPAWLAHEVAPTWGNEKRVSIAFNLPGHWFELAGVHDAAKLPMG